MNLLKALLFYIFIFSNAIATCPPLTAKGIKDSLARLDPHQKISVIERRLEEAGNSYNFFRSFIPYFYEQLSACSKKDLEFSKLLKFEGFITGDPHLKNFGSVLLNKSGSQVTLAINDQDDGGKSYIIADLIRMISSSYIFFHKLHSEKFSDYAEAILFSYINGLKNKKHSFSEETEKLLKDARGKARPGKSWVDTNKKIFKKKKDFNYHLSNSIKTILGELSEIHFNAKIVDSYGLIDYGGGSGGLNRYETLIELKDGSLQWVEYKGIAPKPGYFPMSAGKIPNATDRYRQNISFQLGSAANDLFKVVTIKGNEYLARYRWSGNDSYELGSKPGESHEQQMKRIKKIAIDEAWVLGGLHRKTLESVKANQLAELLNKISTQNLVNNYAILLGDILDKSFQLTR